MNNERTVGFVHTFLAISAIFIGVQVTGCDCPEIGAPETRATHSAPQVSRYRGKGWTAGAQKWLESTYGMDGRAEAHITSVPLCVAHGLAAKAKDLTEEEWDQFSAPVLLLEADGEEVRASPLMCGVGWLILVHPNDASWCNDVKAIIGGNRTAKKVVTFEAPEDRGPWSLSFRPVSEGAPKAVRVKLIVIAEEDAASGVAPEEVTPVIR